MKLKEQINDEITYALSERRKMSSYDWNRSYWIGVKDALEWVQRSRNELTHIDNSASGIRGKVEWDNV